MNFEIYTDESGIEVLGDKKAHSYMAIGGIWIPSEFRERLKNEIQCIKDKYNIRGEMKWKKVSPAFIEFYEAIIKYYFSSDFIRGRVILLDAALMNNIKFNNSDNELGFYKFYYQLIHHWIYDFNSYDIFLDYKVNRQKDRLKDLKNVLGNANLTSTINNVQALPSDQSIGIQLADIITGLVSTKFNNQNSGFAKKYLIELAEGQQCLKRPIAPTGKWEEKLNVFKINLRGGW